MLQKIILILFSVLVFSSCLVPKKPIVEMCQINYAGEECICGLTGGSTEVNFEPLSYCENATAFRPKEWEKVKNYVDEMEVYIKDGCR